jgi:hypothetical protein
LTDNHYGPTDDYGPARIIASISGIRRTELIRLFLAGKIKGYRGGCDYWLDLTSLRDYQLTQQVSAEHA